MIDRWGPIVAWQDAAVNGSVQIRLASAQTGQELVVIGAYSPDGRQLAVVTARTAPLMDLALVDVASGRVTMRTTNPIPMPFAVAWAPDGDPVPTALPGPGTGVQTAVAVAPVSTTTTTTPTTTAVPAPPGEAGGDQPENVAERVPVEEPVPEERVPV